MSQQLQLEILNSQIAINVHKILQSKVYAKDQPILVKNGKEIASQQNSSYLVMVQQSLELYREDTKNASNEY